MDYKYLAIGFAGCLIIGYFIISSSISKRKENLGCAADGCLGGGVLYILGALGILYVVFILGPKVVQGG